MGRVGDIKEPWSSGPCLDEDPRAHGVNVSPSGLGLDFPSLTPKGNLGVSLSSSHLDCASLSQDSPHKRGFLPLSISSGRWKAEAWTCPYLRHLAHPCLLRLSVCTSRNILLPDPSGEKTECLILVVVLQLAHVLCRPRPPYCPGSREH